VSLESLGVAFIEVDVQIHFAADIVLHYEEICLELLVLHKFT
jgi:hypothetical protein